MNTTSVYRTLIVLATGVFLVAALPTMAKGKGKGKVLKSHKSPPPASNPVDAFLQTYDTNHDGKLTPDEMKVFKAENATAAAKALTFDRDHDGTLQADEILAWRSAMAPHSPPPAK